MTIGITGATGQLGRLIVQKLKTKVPAGDIVALVRDPAKGQDLGVAVREADYDRPDTLGPALKGIDTLMFISASEIGKRLPQHRNLIAAAKKAGVKRIVYTSLLHTDDSPINLASEHLPTENEIKASGIPYTILRNGWYTENYTGSIGGALAGGAFLGSAGDGKISSAARSDFADAAVAAVTGDGHAGRTYELAGDSSWTLDDLAKEISRQTGKNVPYRNLPEAEYAKALEGFGLPKVVAGAIASWDVGASKGGLFDESHQLSKLSGHPTTPMSETVRQALKSQNG